MLETEIENPPIPQDSSREKLKEETVNTINPEEKSEEITLKIEPNEYQQNKIIAALNSQNSDILFGEAVENSDERRKEFLQKLSGGEIKEEDIKKLILNIRPPIQEEKDPNNPIKLFGKVLNHEHYHQMTSFLAELAIGDFNRGRELNPTNLAELLQRYPDPITFEKATQKILKEIGSKISLEKYNEFKKSLEELNLILYGKRAEYYNQIKLLQKEARENVRDEDQTKKTQYTKSNNKSIEIREKQEKIQYPDIQIEKINNDESKKILEKTKIHGDSFMGKFLTTEILKEEKLEPKYKTKLGDYTIWLSSAYELGSGRIAVVSYIEKDGEITAYSYYRSDSQGVWRFLPDYTIKENGKIKWVGKGYGEESVTLPIELQKTLSTITKEKIKPKRNPEFIFAGTAKRFGREFKGYYNEVESSPKKLNGNFYPKYNEKISPEQMVLTDNESPDFSKLITSWEQETALYGKIVIEVFPSKDGRLEYMFCRDSSGKIWIGGIQDNSKIQSTGLRETWISGGNLTTPAFEYEDLAGNFGNDKEKIGPYVDMFKNYLSRVPVIREYIESKKISKK